MTSFFVHVFLFSCPCFYLCQHETFISLTKNNKRKLLAQHEIFSSPLRKSTALSVFSHKINSLLRLCSGQWCVDLQCIVYEAIISLYLEEKRLSLEEGSLVLFVFQWCWERQGHGNSRCSGKAVPVLHIPDCQDILLNNTTKTNAPSYSSASFPGDCMHSGTEVWKWDGKQKVCKPDLQKTPVLWNVGGSNIKFFVMYYLVWSERNKLSRNDCSSDAFIKAKPLENILSVAVW